MIHHSEAHRAQSLARLRLTAREWTWMTPENALDAQRTYMQLDQVVDHNLATKEEQNMNYRLCFVSLHKRFKKEGLQHICQYHSLPVSGSKTLLIGRIMACTHQGRANTAPSIDLIRQMEAMACVANVHYGTNVMQCSHLAQEHVNSWVTSLVRDTVC